jgi:hypothetical protein
MHEVGIFMGEFYANNQKVPKNLQSLEGCPVGLFLRVYYH